MEAPQQAAPAFGFKGASDRLGWWNLYFIAKLVLFAMGLIGLHLVENLVFQSSLLNWMSHQAAHTPVSFQLVGTALLSALASTGWRRALPVTCRSNLRQRVRP